MLSSNLLITRRRKDRIYPVYATLNEENLAIARLLIQTYKDNVGKKKGDLKAAVEEFEELGYDYRYVRGLSTLLDRRCQLESQAPQDPIKVRQRIFKIANEGPLPVTHEMRQAIFIQVASELGVPVNVIEQSLYGDLEDELLLKYFDLLDSEALLRQYNLSLTQTLLFHSTELTFTATGNWQNIFRKIKWFGLIYTVWRSDRGYHVRVDGPLSLFKLNRRYGISLAKLFPTIIQNRQWSVKAKILRHKGDRYLHNLEIDSQRHGKYFFVFDEPAEVYDSRVEQNFANRFNALNTGWTLIREPEPIPVGRHVMIPDFAFQKADVKVYMEIMGFWTPQYIHDKIEKLKRVKEIDMILAADRKLTCQKLDKIGEQLNVIYYKRQIPLQPVLAHLRVKEEHLMEAHIKSLRYETFNILEPVVEIQELAERLEVLENALKKVLKEKPISNYVLLEDILIKESKLREIKETLRDQLEKGELNLREASQIIENLGGKRPTRVLDLLGYEIEWRGIDPRSAKIRPK